MAKLFERAPIRASSDVWDDLAGAITFMASDDAGFVTGQVLSVSGGLTMNG